MKESTKKGLEESAIFMVIGTKNYWANPNNEQAEFAKSLNKPFRILLEKGAEIPTGFLDDVEDYKIEEFIYESRESVLNATKKLLKGMIPNESV